MARVISQSYFFAGRISVMAAAFMVAAGSAWAGSPDVIHVQSASEKAQTQKTKPPKDFSKKALIKPLLDQLADTKDAETAKTIAEVVSKLWAHSGSSTVDLLMGQVTKAIATNQVDKALALSDFIVEIAPDFAEGWNRRATVLFIRRSYDASMEDIGRVLEMEPRHFGALSGLGLVLRAMGNKKAALGAFRKALKVHPFMKGPKRVVKQLAPEVEGRGI